MGDEQESLKCKVIRNKLHNTLQTFSECGIFRKQTSPKYRLALFPDKMCIGHIAQAINNKATDIFISLTP